MALQSIFDSAGVVDMLQEVAESSKSKPHDIESRSYVLAEMT